MLSLQASSESAKREAEQKAKAKIDALSEIKSRTTQQLIEKQEIIKSLKAEIGCIKEKIKETRQKRKSLDDMTFEMQEIILTKRTNLMGINGKQAEKERMKESKLADIAKL